MKLPISEICEKFQSGKGILSSEINETGLYPVFGGNGIRGYTDHFNQDGEYAIVGRQGAYCGNVKYNKGKAFLTEHAIVAVPNTNHNALYLSYKLKFAKLEQYQGQSAQPGLSVNTISKVLLDMPDLSTQKKIADVLSCIDDKIALNNKTNSELENMAKTVYDYWFTQFDFPDANGNPYKSSGGKMEYNEVLKREIPAGWEVGKLGDYLDKYGDGIHGTPEYDENGEYYFINGNNLGNKLISFDSDTLKVNDNEYQKIKRTINENTILLSINGTLGSISFYNGEKIAIGKSACFLNIKNQKLKPFVYQIISSETFQKYMYKVAGGSTIKNFAPKQAADFDITIPPTALLEKFNDITISYLEKQIRQEKENEELTKLRDYLLPLLMNGQIEVK